MDKDKLKRIILDQKDVFNSKKHLMYRDINLEKYISTKQIVVITGIRRCGKSSLLSLIKQKMNLDESEYCYFNFDDERINTDVSILEEIYSIHLETYGREPILFLDEIQNIDVWEKFVNRMYEQGTKLFVTGSNATLLSSEISSSLTGRNKLIELFPFSFTEFLQFIGNQYNIHQLSTKSKSFIIKDFDRYFEKGGFPLVVEENDIELINSYFQDILYRDIIARYRLTQVDELKQIGLFFAANTGKLFSYSTLQKISGVKSTSSIKNYLYYYSQSYLFFYLKKFDYSLKKQMMNPKKVYTIDPGIASRIGFNFSENKGRILENIVFLELLRRKKDVFYYSGKKECDFVIKEGLNIVETIQVSHKIDQSNEQREYQGLLEAMSMFNLKQGLLLSYDTEKTINSGSDTIIVMPVWKWLCLSGYSSSARR